jgi:hypothetical protein
MIFVAFFIAKSSLMCQKSPNGCFFFILKQDTLFHHERVSSTSFTAGLKARTVRLQSPKSKPPSSKTKKTTDKQTKKQTDQYAKISKFKKFKISILTRTRTHNPTNQRCEKTHRDQFLCSLRAEYECMLIMARCVYTLAGRASCLHAVGVGCANSPR